MVEEENLRVLVIDSMNGFLNAMPHEQFSPCNCMSCSAI